MGGAVQIDLTADLVLRPAFDPCNPGRLIDVVYGDLGSLHGTGDSRSPLWDVSRTTATKAR